MFRNVDPVVVRKGVGVVNVSVPLDGVAVANLQGWEYDHLEMRLSSQAKVCVCAHTGAIRRR